TPYKTSRRKSGRRGAPPIVSRGRERATDRGAGAAHGPARACAGSVCPEGAVRTAQDTGVEKKPQAGRLPGLRFVEPPGCFGYGKTASTVRMAAVSANAPAELSCGG